MSDADTEHTAPPTVAEQVVTALRVTGIDTLFCLPGVQNDDFFDALVDATDIRPIVSRHEQGAAYMANGASLVAGTPAAFCVVPGPGMLNAGGALTSGYWSNARTLAIVGEIPTFARGRGFGVLHELVDQHAILGQLTKQAELLDDGDSASKQLQSALDALVSGRPRPVSIEVPANRWRTPAAGSLKPPAATMPAIDHNAIDRAAGALRSAERPLIVIGGGAQDAGEAITELAELLQAPVTTRRMGHGAIPTAHPLFAHLAIGHALWKDADVVIGIGSRLEWPLMFWGVDAGKTIVKIDIDPDELDRHGLDTLGVCGDADDACRSLLAALDGTPPRPDRTEEIARRRAAYFAEIDHLRPQLDFLAAIRDVLPDDGIFVEDVTQIGFAAHLAFDFRRPRTFQSTGPAGTLGAAYAQGVGAQVALEREGNGRKALVVAGDGGFLFTGNELATAVQHDIPLVCCLFDDGAFGNVKRIQQQRFGDDRTIVSSLRNPDFVAYAQAFGALGLHADTPDELRARLDEAFGAGVPAIVHVTTGPMPDPWPFFPREPARSSAPCTITALDCGWLRTQERTLIGGGTTDPMEIPVPAWLVRHGDDVVVFDAGLHPSLAGLSEPLGRMSKLFEPMLPEDGSVGPRLEQHDVDPHGSFTVVVSHTHFDHVGGLCEMPNARVVVNADEWSFAMAAGQQGGFDTALVDLGHDVLTVDGEHDLFGDGALTCIPTPGHTCGHQSLRVVTGGGPVILTSDACYFTHTLDDEVLPPFGFDFDLQRRSLAMLRQARDAGTRIVPGHDADVFREIAARPL